MIMGMDCCANDHRRRRTPQGKVAAPLGRDDRHGADRKSVARFGKPHTRERGRGMTDALHMRPDV
jgi:hypothetical protein